MTQTAKAWDWLPGLAVCMALAGAAMALAETPFFKGTLRWSPLLIVIILGMIVASAVKLPALCQPGLKLAQKPVLRWAVAGLGLRLSLAKLASLGLPALGVVTVATFATLAAGFFLAKAMGLGEKIGMLLGTGTSVCGASAIVAADSVVQSEGKDAAASLGIITLWGTLGILVYPLIGQLLQLSPFQYGVWCGASLQELAQSVAAGSAFGPDAQGAATISKMARILLLAPIILILGWQIRRIGGQAGESKAPLVPAFLIVFVVLAGVATLADQGGWAKPWLDPYASTLVTFSLATGMAGVGLQTGFSELKEAGWKPLAFGFILWVVIAVISLLLIFLLPKA